MSERDRLWMSSTHIEDWCQSIRCRLIVSRAIYSSMSKEVGLNKVMPAE